MRCAAFLVMVGVLAPVAKAELRPDEVAILAMAESEQSRKLAEHYAQARKVPKSHILLLPGKPAVTISREAWETQFQPAVRTWLGEKKLEQKIRCLVTCWDVPLRIERRSSQSPVVVARLRELSRYRGLLVRQLGEMIQTVDGIAPEAKPPQRPKWDANTPVADLTAKFEGALQAAQQRAKGLKSEAERQQASATLEKIFAAGGGLSALLRAVAGSTDVSKLKPELVQRLELIKGQVQGMAEGLQALNNLPDTVARDVQMLNLVQKSAGLIGAVQWIDQQLELLKKNETAASFDSELSLLLWPDYPLFGWQPNLLHYRFDHLGAARVPTLMVSRLEAPQFELVLKLVDTAIAVEKTGLAGKIYLDARGIGFNPASDKRGSYGEYDQSLRDLAERLKKHTKLEVVLDNEAKLFQKGQCPDAALYCGWYSLARYVDAFTWQPGSVGYHIASSEAETLRTPGSPVWCNAMLERGVCATIGPVFEPFLSSFPLPDDFFPLLLTGRYTLVEAYYRALPVNSWAMVLVGDPLYNPFQKNPPLTEDALPERMRQKSPELPP